MSSLGGPVPGASLRVPMFMYHARYITQHGHPKSRVYSPIKRPNVQAFRRGGFEDMETVLAMSQAAAERDSRRV